MEQKSESKIVRTPSEWVISEYMENTIQQLIKNNPEAYKKAQEYGEFLLNSRLADLDNPIEKRDIEGEKILFDRLLRDIKQYGITYNELLEYEKKILHMKMSQRDIDQLFSQNFE